MRRNAIAGGIACVVLLAIAVLVNAHCQIPCGIYDDAARFTQMEEHVTTIEKSMNTIRELSESGTANWNQIVRWINNKDDHADELSNIVTYYFMAQRVKPVDPENKEGYNDYINQLTLLHRMLVHSMKAKQTTDAEHVKALHELIHSFRTSYMGKQ